MRNYLRITIVCVLLFGAQALYAATLSIAPREGVYPVGTEFVMSVFVSATQTPVNAIEGKIQFDPSELEIIRVNRMSSILTSWTQEPVFGNDNGTIVFGGLTATSGFTGIEGELLLVTAKGKRPVNARMTFTQGSAAHAADGSGSNTIDQFENALLRFTTVTDDPTATTSAPTTNAQTEVVSSESTESIEATSTGEVLGARTFGPLQSSTHPDESRWYATTTARVFWEYASDTVAVYLAFNQKATSTAIGTRYDGTLTEKNIRDIDEGEWYAHLTRVLADDSKDRKSIAIRTDVTPPKDFTFREVERGDSTDPRIQLYALATDTPSGIQKYTFQVDDAEPIEWKDDGSHTTMIGTLAPGTHTIRGRAYDAAEQFVEESITVVVEQINPPVLMQPTAPFREGKPIQVSGTALPQATVRVIISLSGITSEETVTAGGDGQFTFISTGNFSPGQYVLHAIQKDSRGAESAPTEQIIVTVDSTIWGMLERHPMIPYVLGVLLFIPFTLYFFLRRARHGIDDSDDASEEERDDAVTHSATQLSQSPVRVPHVGAVVNLRRE